MKKMLAALLSISLFANVLLTLAVSADDSLADSHMVKIVPMRYEEITAIVADIGLENGIVTFFGFLLHSVGEPASETGCHSTGIHQQLRLERCR